MSKPILKKQKVISDVPSQTIHISDIRQLIAFYLPFKDQIRLNRITKVCQDQIKHKQRHSANELYNFIKIKKQNRQFHYSETLFNNPVIFFDGYSPFIVNTMDGRSFNNVVDAKHWADSYKVTEKLSTIYPNYSDYYNYQVDHDSSYSMVGGYFYN